MRRVDHGFSLVEVLIALALLALSLTAMAAGFISSQKYGAMARRQATAVALARSTLADVTRAPWTDARLANTNTQNDRLAPSGGNTATYVDTADAFASATVPTGADAPDYSYPAAVKVGDESYFVYVNVCPDLDSGGVEQGREVAVIVRYSVSGSWVRAVAVGYRYNPSTNGSGALGMPL